MDLELNGKVALVSGSSRGIGLAIAQTLHLEGCKVVINGRDPHRLAGVAQSLGVESMAADVADEKSAQALIDFALRRHGAIDILVCNVGSGTSLPVGEEDWKEWSRMLDINLRPSINVLRSARQALAASRGVALCISSICGSAALGAPLGYSAAKAALNSYVRGMCRVLGPQGVRINALSPGNVLFEGSSWESRLQNQPDTVREMLQREVALQRLGNAQEIANVAAFLCSPKSSFLTGEVVVADGGQLRS
jgi:3-oxoacyl-[acyl-carrier protein] reductase